MVSRRIENSSCKCHNGVHIGHQIRIQRRGTSSRRASMLRDGMSSFSSRKSESVHTRRTSLDDVTTRHLIACRLTPATTRLSLSDSRTIRTAPWLLDAGDMLGWVMASSGFRSGCKMSKACWTTPSSSTTTAPGRRRYSLAVSPSVLLAKVVNLPRTRYPPNFSTGSAPCRTSSEYFTGVPAESVSRRKAVRRSPSDDSDLRA